LSKIVDTQIAPVKSPYLQKLYKIWRL